MIPKSTPVTSAVVELVFCSPAVVNVYVKVPLSVGTVTSVTVFWVVTPEKLYAPFASDVVVVITVSPASTVPFALLSAYNVTVTPSKTPSPASWVPFVLLSSNTVPETL